MHELLPWYLTGRLEPRLANEFREHLALCDACRREMSTLEALRRELAEHGAGFLDDHPSAERVVGAIRGELSDEQATDVRRHLALCATCAEEASWVAGQASYGEAVVPKGRRESGWSWGWAAGIAALLLLASLPWVFVSGRAGARTGVVEVHHLEEARRAVSRSNVFTLDRDQREIMLILEVDVPGESFPLRVTLVDGSGATVRDQQGVATLLDGYLHYACARRDCPAGEYALRVYASGEAEPALVFEFEVVEP